MDDVEEKYGFNYESFFDQQIQKKKMDHSYRVFKKVSRDATNFPAAREFSWGKKEITVRNIIFLPFLVYMPNTPILVVGLVQQRLPWNVGAPKGDRCSHGCCYQTWRWCWRHQVRKHSPTLYN